MSEKRESHHDVFVFIYSSYRNKHNNSEDILNKQVQLYMNN